MFGFHGFPVSQWLVCSVLCGFFASSLYGQAASELLDLAAESTGQNVFSTASLMFEAEILDPPPSPEQIKMLTDRQAETLRFAIETYKNLPEVRKSYEDRLPGVAADVAARAADYRMRKVEGSYFRSGPRFGGDVFYEVKVKKGGDDPYGCLLLQRELDEKNLRSIYFDVRSKSVVASPFAASVGIVEPILVGRLSGGVLRLVESKAIRSFRIDEAFPKSNPKEVAIRFEEKLPIKVGDNETSDIVISGLVVVDTSKGYVCPLVELRSGEDGVIYQASCKDYVKVGNSNIWFPTYAELNSKELGGDIKVTLRFKESTMRFNEPLSKDIFSIDAPSGTQFLYQLGKPRNAGSICPIKVRIDDLDYLMEHECLRVSNIEQSDSMPSPWFVVLSISLICFVVGALYFGRRKAV